MKESERGEEGSVGGKFRGGGGRRDRWGDGG